MHGGAIASLLDSVLVPAIGSSLPEGSRYATVDLHVQFMEGVIDSDVVAEGWVVRRGRRVVFGQAEAQRGVDRSARRHGGAHLRRVAAAGHLTSPRREPRTAAAAGRTTARGPAGRTAAYQRRPHALIMSTSCIGTDDDRRPVHDARNGSPHERRCRPHRTVQPPRPRDRPRHARAPGDPRQRARARRRPRHGGRVRSPPAEGARPLVQRLRRPGPQPPRADRHPGRADARRPGRARRSLARRHRRRPQLRRRAALRPRRRARRALVRPRRRSASGSARPATSPVPWPTSWPGSSTARSAC